MDILTPLHNRRFWRAMAVGKEHLLLKRTTAKTGMFHYGTQRALYMSDSAEGCRMIVRGYLRPDGPFHRIFPMKVEDAQVADLTRADIRDALGISLDDIHAPWQKAVKEGQHPVTWTISDRLREMGADGVLTPSHSRPDLTHLTLFKWQTRHGAKVWIGGPGIPF
jgi:RES domain-containing protein